MSKKKLQTPPPLQKCLYLSYNERHSGGESLSDEQWSSRADAHTEVTFTGVGREKDEKNFFPSTREIPVTDEVFAADTVYLVVYRYQDGDTFGTSYGNWGIWLVTTNEEEALKAGADIESGALSKKGAYLPWEGYFSGLENVEIHSFRVGKSGRVIHH
jgi:hypothetical protein